MVILIADDEYGVRRALELLMKSDHDVITFDNAEGALEELAKGTIDLVLTDLLPVIRKGKSISPSTSFVMMASSENVSEAVDAIQSGAEDYFLKPFDVSEIEDRIRKFEELRSLKFERDEVSEVHDLSNRIVGVSESAKEIREFITYAAATLSPVLLEGPTGSGKEFTARLIHESSMRAIYPLINFDCAQGDEDFIEMELFGLEKGSRNGTAPRLGKVELARGGTLLLNSVNELPKSIQTKLVGLLRDKTFLRVGGSREIRSNARVVATSDGPLRKLVREQKFLDSLYYQINVLTLDISPLSSRPEDLPLLISHFWEKARKESRSQAALSPITIRLLAGYSYPGNIRELINVTQRLAVVGEKSGLIEPEKLPLEFKVTRESLTKKAA